MEREPVRLPVAVGVNVTCRAHVPPAAATVAVHPSWTAKSPVAVTLETVSELLPMLMTLTVCAALGAPSGCAENVSAAGSSAAAGALAGAIFRIATLEPSTHGLAH